MSYSDCLEPIPQQDVTRSIIMCPSPNEPKKLNLLHRYWHQCSRLKVRYLPWLVLHCQAHRRLAVHLLYCIYFWDKTRANRTLGHSPLQWHLLWEQQYLMKAIYLMFRIVLMPTYCAVGFRLDGPAAEALFSSFDCRRTGFIGLPEYIGMTLFLQSASVTFKAFDPQGTGQIHMTFDQVSTMLTLR